MRRPLGALIAFSLAVLAGPVSAAEITRVATSGEPGNPFDIDISIRWDRFDERGTIVREGTAGTASVPGGVVVDGQELRFNRARNAIVPRVAVGLWNDLELHFELPYVLADDQTRRFGLVYGVPSGGTGSPPLGSIENPGIDASGNACTGTCALFPVAPKTTVYHGARAGDLKAGLAWGIFNDRKDDTKPFWLVGLDVTFPSSAVYEPGLNRAPDTWASEFQVPAKAAPFGEGIWKWDLYTAFSRRMGYVDPYVRAHATAAFKSARTYSNCKYADALVAAGQMNDQAVARCAALGDAAAAKLPWVVGLTLGTEVVPYEDAIESQRVALDFRLHADYTSSQRFYNELTDATGKLLQTEGYLEIGGLVGLYLRASKNVSIQTTASLSTRTDHYLTGEPLQKDGAINPNFDWRYDAPGRRFRITEVGVFELSFAGVIQF